MKVKIVNVKENEPVDALIREAKAEELPSMHDGWKFNFDKEFQKLKYASAYVLVAEDTPDVVEGCLVFEMKGKLIPYMSLIEVAPHNRVDPKRYELVAGCLIAFAYRLSLIHGKDYYKGWLTFDVLEQSKEDEIKLMAVYSTKYNAKRAGDTTMYIMDKDGEDLIEKYLKEK